MLTKRKAVTTQLSPRASKKTRIPVKEEADSPSVTPRRSTRTKTVTNEETPSPTHNTLVKETVAKAEEVTPRSSKIKLESKVEVNGVAEKVTVKEEVEQIETPAKKAPTKSPKKAAKKTTKVEAIVEEVVKGEAPADAAKPTKRKRKTKEEKEAEMIPLAARTQGLKMFVGAHVSGAGGMVISLSLYCTLLYQHPTTFHNH